MRYMTKETLETVRRLYDDGLDDISIGAMVGRTKSAIAKWRYRNNLPTNKQRVMDDPDDQAEFNRLYRQGETDRAIAVKLGVSNMMVGIHRQSLGLPSNFRRIPPLGGEEGQCRFRELYNQGYNDKEIAAELGFTAPVIGAYRNKQGLPPHGRDGRGRRKPVFKADKALIQADVIIGTEFSGESVMGIKVAGKVTAVLEKIFIIEDSTGYRHCMSCKKYGVQGIPYNNRQTTVIPAADRAGEKRIRSKKKKA